MKRWKDAIKWREIAERDSPSEDAEELWGALQAALQEAEEAEVTERLLRGRIAELEAGPDKGER